MHSQSCGNEPFPLGRYRFYLKRQAHDLRLFMQDEEVALPSDINYADVQGLSYEVRERLTSLRPASIVRHEALTIPSILMNANLFEKGRRKTHGGHDANFTAPSHRVHERKEGS